MSNKVRSGKNGFHVVEEKRTSTLVIEPKFSGARASTGAANGIGPANGTYHRTPDGRLNEAVGLAQAIDLEVCDALIIPVPKIRPSTLLGGGNVETLAEHIREQGIELVIMDHTLTPVQQRNLERELKVKVLDRTGLILEIFGKRARTNEGRLQVELAHLEYQKSRLVRSWTHLERQRGGFGFLGGPGETQIEADRRQLQGRIVAIKSDLEQVKKTRELHRKGRKRTPYPIVALVGYTNAGKSTLFNRLTGAEVHAEDLLFATLDPTMRELELPGGAQIILSDTVGFISDLPTHLIASFRATLEEVLEADIILHVHDMTHEEHLAQKDDVNQVLKELGVDPASADANIIHVWNKTDMLNEDTLQHMAHDASRADTPTALISAETGVGCDQLLETIDQVLTAQHEVREVLVEPHEGALQNWLYENSEIVEREDSENGDAKFVVRISADKSGKLDGMLSRR